MSEKKIKLDTIAIAILFEIKTFNLISSFVANAVHFIPIEIGFAVVTSANELLDEGPLL